MSPMLDPRELWGNDAPVVEGISTDKVFKTKYVLPDIKDAKNESIFLKTANIIAKICRDKFIQGFVDLDLEWQTNPTLEPYRKSLFAQYPKPYQGNMLYLGKLQIKEIEDESIDEKTKVKSKVKRVGICEKSQFGARVSLNICIYHNKKLGWEESWTKPPKHTERKLDPKTGAYEDIEVEESLPDDAEPFKEKYRWKPVSSFITLDQFADIETLVEKVWKKGETLPKEFFAFIIGSNLTEGKGTKGKNYWNIDVGKVF